MRLKARIGFASTPVANRHDFSIKKARGIFGRPRAFFYPGKVDTKKAKWSQVSQRVLNQ